MMNDPLANVLSAIKNYEDRGKRVLLINPFNGIIRNVLDIMKTHGFVGDLEIISESKGGFANLHLLGHVNKCGVIKPRFSVKVDEFVKFEKRFLPAKDVGILVVSTSKGVMTHYEAKEKGMGGKLIAFCY